MPETGEVRKIPLIIALVLIIICVLIEISAVGFRPSRLTDTCAPATGCPSGSSASPSHCWCSRSYCPSTSRQSCKGSSV